MGVDQVGAVHTLLAEQDGDQVVDRADGNHRHPAEGAGVDVAYGPVGVMRQRLTVLIDIIGPSKVDMP